MNTEITLRDMKRILKKAIRSQQRTGRKKTLQITSSPGVGKTEICLQIGKAFEQSANFAPTVLYLPMQSIFIEHRSSYVENGTLKWAFDDKIPFDQPVVLIVDEFCDLSPLEAAVTNGLIYDHKWGDRTLCQGSIVLACGNRPEHGASANVPPSQSINRIMELRVKADLDQWLEDYALPNNLNPIVLAFLRFVMKSENKDLLADGWRDNADGYNFPSARSATMLADYVSEGYEETDLAASIGYFGPEYGAKFHAFATLQDCNPQEILANPENAPIPDAIDKRLLLLALLASVADDQNVGEILKFADRLDSAYSLGLFEDIARRLPTIKNSVHWVRIIAKHKDIV